MQLNIKYTEIKSSVAVEEYVEKKMGSLDAFLRGLENTKLFVEVGKTTHHHHKGMVFRAEGQIRMPGRYSIRAVSVQPKLHLAIDEVKDELQRQLKDYKNKKKTKALRGARKMKERTGR